MKRHLWLALGLALAIFLLQTASLLSEAVQYHDNEELHNGTVALELLHGHLDQLFALQARPYCGGCSVVSLSAAGLFAFFPPTLYVFKGVAIGVYLLMFAAGFRLLLLHAGTASAIAFGLYWLLPPYPWFRIALVSYGNHYESALYPLLALNLALPIGLGHLSARREAAWKYLLMGAILGFGLYTCFTTASSVIATLLVAFPFYLRGRRFDGSVTDDDSAESTGMRWTLNPLGLLLTLVGCTVGMLPWLAYWLATRVNPVTAPIYRSDDFSPGLEHLPEKLESLFAPHQLEAIFGFPWGAGGRPLAWGAVCATAFAILVAASVVRGQRRSKGSSASTPPGRDGEISASAPQSTSRALVALAGLLIIFGFLGMYLAARYFYVEHPENGYPSPLGLRYLAPVYMGIGLVFSVAVGALLEWRGTRRVLGFALLSLLLLSGAHSRLGVFSHWPWSTAFFHELGADYPFFRPPASWQIGEERHRSCTSQSLRSQAFHQWSLGWLDARAVFNTLHIRPADHPLPVGAELGALQEQLGKLQPEDPSHAKDYYDGVAWCIRDQLLGGDTTLVELMQTLSSYLVQLSEEARVTIAREVLRVPDWLERQLPESGAGSRIDKIPSIIRQLESTSLSSDMLESTTWALGGVAARSVLPAASDRPQSVLEMVEIIAKRMGGRDWSPSEKWKELQQLPSLPDTLEVAYIEGFGEELGRNWGTRFKIPPPLKGTPKRLLEDYQDAYRRGQSVYFLE